jgi:hypothetical protein
LYHLACPLVNKLPVDAHYLRKHYQTLLEQQRYLTLVGKVRISELVGAFQNYFPSALLTLLHCEVDLTASMHSSWLMRLVGTKKRQIPLHHILTLQFLKSSVQQSFQEPQSTPRSAVFGQGPWPCLNPICLHYKQLHIHICRIRQKARSKFSGIFACDCGFAYSRSLSEADPDDPYQYNSILTYGKLWESTLSDLRLDSTLSNAQIAQQLGVSVNTIFRQVKKLGLPSRLQMLERERKTPSEVELSFHREQWLKTIANYPGQGIGVVVRQSMGGYDWLRRYDLTWLQAHLPPHKARQPPGNRWHRQVKPYGSRGGQKILPQEWEGRDRETAEVIRQRAQELLDAPGAPQKITLLKLQLALPSSSNWFRNAAFLPLTMQALDEVLESTEQFAVRRVNWVAQQGNIARKPLSHRELVKLAGVDVQQHKPLVQAAIQEAMRMLDRLN